MFNDVRDLFCNLFNDELGKCHEDCGRENARIIAETVMSKVLSMVADEAHCIVYDNFEDCYGSFRYEREWPDNKDKEYICKRCGHEGYEHDFFDADSPICYECGFADWEIKEEEEEEEEEDGSN